MPVAELLLTDGTTSINLLSDTLGFYLEDWTPSTAPAKDDGIWQNSPFVDGRRLAMKQYDNIIDTFTVGIAGRSPDDLIYFSQEMRRLLRKASQYWTTDWQNEPVWIEAKASCETNKRYAILTDGRLGQDDNPYSDPMLGTGTQFAMPELPLVLEHQYWTAQEPLTADCVYVRNHNRYPWVMWLAPWAGSSMMYSPSVVFDDLPNADFTCEIWVYGNLLFGAGSGYLFWKSGWYAKVDAGRTISCFADFTGVDASLTTVTALPVNPQGWTHIAIKFDHANHRFSVAINGVAAGGAPVDGTVNYVGDAATDFYVASTSAGGTDLLTDITTTGSRMTWTRVSNSVRADALGTRVYNKLPDFDANTLCITNGGKTWAGGNIAWTYNFGSYYTGNILDATNRPSYGLLGVEKYLENTTSYFCDFKSAYSISADREGCGLDYAFWQDTSAGTFGVNIIDNNPSNLMPPAPDAADFFYFGCGVYQGGAVPQAIVMEFSAAWSTTNTFILEYSTGGGGWATVPHYTTNASFQKTVLVITSEPPVVVADTVNGYYAYWYRINWSSVAGGQRSIIAGPALISSPGIEIDNTAATNSIFGDLPAIARLGFDSQLSLHDSSANAAYARRALISLYSYAERDISLTSRTNWFTPFINLSWQYNLPSTKPHNQPGIQISATRAAGSYIAIFDATAPCTWITQVRVTIASTEYITLSIYDYAALCYRGKFRLLARMKNVLGGATKGEVTVAAYLTSPYNLYIGNVAQSIPVLEEIIDFGIIELPAVGEGRSSEIDITLIFTALVAGNHDINLHDLIFLPVDEWTAEIEQEPPLSVSSYTAPSSDNYYSLLDPVISPKDNRSCVSGYLGSASTVPLGRDELYYPMGQRSSMSDKFPFLQTNCAQKLFMIQGFHYTITTPANILYQFPYYFTRGWTIEKQERYESMRGNR